VTLRLSRVVRTDTSEIYLLWDDDERVAQVDLHYAPDVIHATLILERDVEPIQIEALIQQVDRDVVASYLQDFERDNFLVTVFRGYEVMTRCDEDDDDEEDDLAP